MIDFRYHLVSIVAVFLALAIGIVVGATALQGHVVAGLDRASKIEQRQIDSTRAKNKELQNQIAGDGEFAQASAPLLLANLLSGQKVVLVTAPGADGSTISGITSALDLAGAKVTGQAQLQPAFFDTSASTETSLDALAQKVAPPTVTPGEQTAVPSLSTEVAGQQNAAEVIAPALVSSDGTDLPASQAEAVLSGFAQQGYLQVNPSKGYTASALSEATLAVVVIPASPPASGDSDPANQALLALADQLELQSRGVVLAGSLPGSGSGSAIDELINGSTGIKVSSVDNANSEAGQIMVAQALSYLLAGKKPAAYGVYASAVPSPAPTPSPTPTPTPSTSVKHKSAA
ncbi:MAG TPA: copper transporter [Streptosporangiaceae bacterium]|nr:copper transporter [Streptosporangiaceae bacterium]